jgi:hypothetical protein
MKQIFKGAAMRASCGAGPLGKFYTALLAKGMKPEMARLTLARKIAAIFHASVVAHEGEYLFTSSLLPKAHGAPNE